MTIVTKKMGLQEWSSYNMLSLTQTMVPALENSLYAIKDKNILKKLSNFFEEYKSIRYKKGEVIIRANDLIKNVFFIKRGHVRIYSISDSGEEATFHIARPGSYFPMMLVLSDVRNSYYCEATTAVDLRVAPVDTVVEFVKNDPEILFDLTSRFASGLCGLMSRLENLIFDPAYIKLIVLLEYFMRRFGKKDGEGIIIQLPLTHTSIASWLGINRETVSRQMKKLNKKGLIERKKGFLIISDVKKLHDQLPH